MRSCLHPYQTGADRVCKQLIAANLNAASIHGDKSQRQRNRAMDAFRSGETSILVATDVVARGIDIDDISHVVNFEIPNVPESYVHRIGRTARAGRSGIAISLCDPSETGLLKDIEKLIGNKLRSAASKGAHTTPHHSETRHSDLDKVNRDSTRNQKQDKVTVSAGPNRGARDEKKPVSKAPGPDQPTDGLLRMFSNIGTSQAVPAA